MRFIRTTNAFVEFIEADNSGKILSSRGFQMGSVYFQIKNGKVTFYMNDNENPYKNDIWTTNIPLIIDDVEYATEDEVSNALHHIMNSNLQDKIDELSEDLAAESARAEASEAALDDAIDDERDRATSAETALQTEITELSGTVATFDERIESVGDGVSAVTTSLNAEVSRATAKDAAHDAEISGLTTSLQNEITRATGAENSLRSDLNAEVSARTTADAAQLQRITALEVGKADANSVYTKSESDTLLAQKADKANAVATAEYVSANKTINFKNINGTVLSTIDATPFVVDGMLDSVSIVNGNLVFVWNTDSGKQTVSIPLTDIFNPSNYYDKTATDALLATKLNTSDFASYSALTKTAIDNKLNTSDFNTYSAATQNVLDNVYLKSETSGATQISSALAEKLDVNDFNTYSGAVDTLINSKASQSTVDALNDVVSSHTSDNSIHLTSGDVQSQIDSSISGKVNVDDNVVSAYTFNKSTKIVYPDIAAWREPSIPNGTKKISISFAMLPSNNQLFESLQFVTFNPFNIVDVASGLTVGVAEDTSTFPYTYTITSVTIADSDIIGYDLSENDTLLNLYALGDYQLIKAKPKGMNVFSMYIDVLEDIESGQTAEVVNDGIIKNFENIGKYLQNERNRVNIEIDNKLDATAYTPTIVDSSLRQGSTNPVENGAIFDEVRVQTSSGGGETILIFDENNETTNYPLGTTEFIVWADTTERFVDYTFYNDSTKLGNVTVAYFDTVNVTQNNLPGATYTISGEFVTFTYQPLGITKIVRNGDGFVEKVINPPTYTSLKSVVNTKQNQLTPGTGISIQNDVISVTATSPTVDAYTKAESDAKFATITNFNSHSGDSIAHITSSERVYWNNKSDFSGNYSDLTNKPTIPTRTSQLENDSEYISYPAIKDMATKTWVGEQGYLTEQDISGKQDISGMTAYTQNSTFNAFSAATNSALANKQNQLTPGTGISIQNDVISVTASSPSVDAYTKAESDAKFATITNFNSHSGDTTSHTTSSEKQTWNNKPNVWSGSEQQWAQISGGTLDNNTIYLIY